MSADSRGEAALVVDLDADLLRGNLASELFWSELRDDWRQTLFARTPRPDADLLDITTLPYDAETLERCRMAQATGQRCVLVSAASPALTEAVAAHLGCFDAAEGGLSHPPSAASPRAASGQTARHLLRAMRPHQWVKNLLVFLPLVAAQAFTLEALTAALLAFLSFGLIASSVYLVNDLVDLPADRRHSSKRNRPFASGRLPLRYGTRAAPLLFGTGLVIAGLVSLQLLGVMLVYAIATTLYSFRVKGTLGADIVFLSVLYTLRIIAGGAATGITLSMWLLSFSIFLFLSLAAVKRLAELVDMERAGITEKAAGRAYEPEDRPIVAMIATSAGFLAVLVLALHINTPDVQVLYDAPHFLWGICLLLLFWISRTVLLAHRGLVDQDPIVFAFTDRVSQASGAVTVVLFILAILA